MIKSLTKSDQELIGNKFSEILNDLSIYFDSPIISQGDSWVRVNDIIIILNENDHEVRRNGSSIARFFYKSWAIAFAVALAKNNRALCFELVNAEQKIEKFQEEIIYYKHSIQNTILSNNPIKEGIFKNRLSKTEFDLKNLISSISSCIKSQPIA